MTLSILLIDDNSDDRSLITRILESEFEDSEISEATNFESCKDILEQNHFDVAIIDYQLPDTDGLAILQLIRQHDANCITIMFAQSGSQEIAVEAMKSGLDDYIVKSSENYFRLAIAVRRALERAAAQRKAKGLEARLQTLLNQLSVGVYRLTSTGELLEYNLAFLRLLGLESVEQIPSDFALSNYFSSEDYDELLAQLRQNGAVREREIQLQQVGKAKRLWVKITKQFTYYNDFKIIDGLIEDISDRKTAEQEREHLLQQEQAARQEAELQRQRMTFLAEANRLLTRSLDYHRILNDVAQLIVSNWADWCVLDLRQFNAIELTSPLIVAVQPDLNPLFSTLSDSDFNLIHAKLSQLDGFEPAEPKLVEQMSAIYPFDLGHAHPQSYLVAPIVSRQTQLGTLTLVSCKQEQRYTQADLSLAIDLAQRIGSAIDNTHLYSIAQEANRLKDQFLTMVSHELRTPLSSILGWARLLKRKTIEDPVIDQALTIIERNAIAQERLINDLLDMSRIVQNQLTLNLAPVDLIPLIDETLEMLRPIAETKSIQLETNLSLEVGQIMGDQVRIQQVIWNLLTNAFKFTPVGGQVQIKLSQEQHFEAQDGISTYAQLSITDTGRGISSEFLPYVFDRFRQETLTTTDGQKGLGLGLAIVRQLIEMHGGTVYGFSEGVDRGATFIVRLPLLTEACILP